MSSTASRPAVGRLAGGLQGLIGLFCTVIAIAYLGLVRSGVWHDEYTTIAQIREGGLSYAIQRMLHWSPRPLSEIFVYLYAEAVSTFHNPLVATALAPVWAMLAAAVLLPSIATRRGLAVSGVLGCLFLLGHRVAEVFYWPVGAFAYLPTLAALALLLTLDIAGLADRVAGRIWAIVALLVAATSSEIGALFALAYCVLAGGVGALTGDRRSLALILPAAVASGVLSLVATGRVAMNVEGLGDKAVAHHLMPALTAAVRSFGVEVAGSDAAGPMIAGLVTKSLFFAGVYLSLSMPAERLSSHRQLMRLVLALALLGSAFVMLAAADYQFGYACCERHATMRQCYVLIAIGALALFTAAWRPAPSPTIGGLCLLMALAVPLSTDAAKVRWDYRHHHDLQRARAATWQSAAERSPTIIVVQAPTGQIVGGAVIPAGTYTISGAEPHSFAQALLGFFGKTTGVFLPPAEGEADR